MPYKSREKQKEAQHQWYLRKKNGPSVDWAARRKSQISEYRDKTRKPNKRKIAREEGLARSENIEKLVSDARNGGCRACGEIDHSCLDFHHIDPKKKSFSISRRLLKENAARIDDEISKCVVLCKNCHAKFHSGRVVIW